MQLFFFSISYFFVTSSVKYLRLGSNVNETKRNYICMMRTEAWSNKQCSLNRMKRT